VDDTSLLKASTTSVTVTADTDTDTDAGATDANVTPPTDGTPTVDTSVGSGTTTESGQIELKDTSTVGLDDGAGETPGTKPTTKRANPGAKLAGALKHAGDQIGSAVNDLGKKLTKRPSKKAPAAEKDSSPAQDKSDASE
jgi:hypothetical protein